MSDRVIHKLPTCLRTGWVSAVASNVYRLRHDRYVVDRRHCCDWRIYVLCVAGFLCVGHTYASQRGRENNQSNGPVVSTSDSLEMAVAQMSRLRGPRRAISTGDEVTREIPHPLCTTRTAVRQGGTPLTSPRQRSTAPGDTPVWHPATLANTSGRSPHRPSRPGQ